MRRDVNFFSVYSARKAFRSGADTVTVVGLIVICVSLVAIAGIFSAFKMQSMVLDASLSRQTNYLQSASVQQAQQQIKQYDSKISVLNDYTNAVSGALRQYQAIPVFDSDVIESLSKDVPAELIIGDLKYQGGQLTLNNCSCTNQQTPYTFVHNLRSNSYLSDIQYGGYQLNGSVYTFNVVCTVREVKSHGAQ